MLAQIVDECLDSESFAGRVLGWHGDCDATLVGE
jgi:hypothetical protein